MKIELPEINFAAIGDRLLVGKIHQLLNTIEGLLKQIGTLTKQLEEAQQEIARLKGQSKKPHFDAKSTGKEKKPSCSITAFLTKGMQKKQWHKSSRKKELPIDTHVPVAEVEICTCGSQEFRSVRTETKIVQGMVIRRNNVAYHGRTKRCITCGRIYKPAFPAASKGLLFDSTIQTLISHLKFDGRFSHLLLHRFFTAFEVEISYGEITQILKRNSKKLIPSFLHLRVVGIKKGKYNQTDATGSKRMLKDGRIINQYLQVVGHKFLSIFKITRKYNAQELNQLLGKAGQKKPLLSDDGSPNNACRCGGQQLCWVHEIRLYKKLFPYFTGYQALHTHILLQWRKFYHMAKAYGVDPPTTATEKARKDIETLFDTITAQETGYADLDKQLKLTKKKRHKLLFFLDHPYIPIQNNQCEQDLRAGVIIRKISGPTKSVAGDRSFERHLSVIQTIKKQGLPVFQTLHGLLTGQLSPSILTVKTV